MHRMILLIGCLALTLGTTQSAIAQPESKPRDPNVGIEVRVVSVSDTFFERIGIDFDFHHVNPTTGVLGRQFEFGWGGRLGGTMNLFDSVGGNPNRKVDIHGGYNYLHLRGNGEFQLNGPGTNLRVNSANSHTGDLGVSVRQIYNNLEFGAGVFYSLGGIQANTQQVSFNAVAPAVFLKQNPDTDAFIHGYRVRVFTDWRVNDRVKVGGFYDIGQDFTGVLENDRRGSLTHRFGGHVTFLFGQRDFRTRRTELLQFITPRIINP